MHRLAAIQDMLKLCSESRVGELVDEEEGAKQARNMDATFVDRLPARC